MKNKERSTGKRWGCGDNKARERLKEIQVKEKYP